MRKDANISLTGLARYRSIRVHFQEILLFFLGEAEEHYKQKIFTISAELHCRARKSLGGGVVFCLARGHFLQIDSSAKKKTEARTLLCVASYYHAQDQLEIRILIGCFTLGRSNA